MNLKDKDIKEVLYYLENLKHVYVILELSLKTIKVTKILIEKSDIIIKGGGDDYSRFFSLSEVYFTKEAAREGLLKEIEQKQESLLMSLEEIKLLKEQLSNN